MTRAILAALAAAARQGAGSDPMTPVPSPGAGPAETEGTISAAVGYTLTEMKTICAAAAKL